MYSDYWKRDLHWLWGGLDHYVQLVVCATELLCGNHMCGCSSMMNASSIVYVYSVTYIFTWDVDVYLYDIMHPNK